MDSYHHWLKACIPVDSSNLAVMEANVSLFRSEPYLLFNYRDFGLEDRKNMALKLKIQSKAIFEYIKQTALGE